MDSNLSPLPGPYDEYLGCVPSSVCAAPEVRTRSIQMSKLVMQDKALGAAGMGQPGVSKQWALSLLKSTYKKTNIRTRP
eukprot:3337931-Amphidinium_carterae.2